MEHWKVYLSGRRFLVRTDNSALKYILGDSGKFTLRQRKWRSFLNQFQFDIEHIKGKSNVDADALSRPEEEDLVDLISPGVESYIEKCLELNQITASPEVITRGDMVSTIGELYKELGEDVCCLEQGSIKTKDQSHREGAIDPGMTAKLSQLKGHKNPNNVKRNRYAGRLSDQYSLTFEGTGLSADCVRTAQSDDEYCTDIMTFIDRKELPIEKDRARRVLVVEENFIMNDGILYNIHTTLGPKAKTRARLVIPTALRRVILEVHHDAAIGGHLSAQKMLSVMRSKYFWSGMCQDVHDYCNSCDLCAQTKRMTHPIRPPLTLRDPSPRPWEIVNIDALERLPRSRRGNRHLIVVVDYYSRYVLAYALPNLTAKAVAEKFFDNVICRVGGVQKIVSDNGKCFTGEEFRIMCEKLKITQAFSSVAHPQTSGLVERTNRSLLNIFRNYVNEKQNNWDEGLPEMLFALNTTEAYSLGVTPFLLCHGYDPVNPIETNVKLDLEGAGTVHDRFTDLLQTQRNAHDLSRNTFKNIQTGMKARYDTHSHEVPLREGDRVWLFWPRIKDNFTKLKLAKVFHGPYVIVSFHTDSTVWLKHTVTGKFMTKPVTVHRLKRSIDRKTLEDKWPDYDIGYDDLEDLQVQDLPTDSFIQMFLISILIQRVWHQMPQTCPSTPIAKWRTLLLMVGLLM